MPDAINKTIFSFNIFVLWSQLADKLTIEAGFYMLTISQSLLLHLQQYQV
jgi:hypothetical protein